MYLNQTSFEQTIITLRSEQQILSFNFMVKYAKEIGGKYPIHSNVKAIGELAYRPRHLVWSDFTKNLPSLNSKRFREEDPPAKCYP